jgi:hypothetical protein
MTQELFYKDGITIQVESEVEKAKFKRLGYVKVEESGETPASEPKRGRKGKDEQIPPTELQKEKEGE